MWTAIYMCVLNFLDPSLRLILKNMKQCSHNSRAVFNVRAAMVYLVVLWNCIVYSMCQSYKGVLYGEKVLKDKLFVDWSCWYISVY